MEGEERVREDGVGRVQEGERGFRRVGIVCGEFRSGRMRCGG